MTIRECYDIIGGNYNEMMGRLLTEERIKKFLLMFPKDDSFVNLCDAMSARDYETAFRCAHTLKGTCLNLGLDKLRASSERITEALRAELNNEADKLLPQVIDDYSLTVNAIKQID